MNKEGSGKRVYRPKPGSLREKLLEWFMANPKGALTREDIINLFGCGHTSLDSALASLKRCGFIAVNGTRGHVCTYSMVKAPSWAPRKRAAEKPVRKWPDRIEYEAPRPIPNSVFALAATLGV